MKKTIITKSTDELMEALREGEQFDLKDGALLTKAKYNSIFSAMGSLSITLVKASDTELIVSTASNLFMKLVTLFITIFFWTIGALALLKGSDRTAAVITAFLAPSVMWIIDIIFVKIISKMIFKEIEDIEYELGI